MIHETETFSGGQEHEITAEDAANLQWLLFCLDSRTAGTVAITFDESEPSATNFALLLSAPSGLLAMGFDQERGMPRGRVRIKQLDGGPVLGWSGG